MDRAFSLSTGIKYEAYYRAGLKIDREKTEICRYQPRKQMQSSQKSRLIARSGGPELAI
jgi:hypothetical protein